MLLHDSSWSRSWLLFSCKQTEEWKCPTTRGDVRSGWTSVCSRSWNKPNTSPPKIFRHSVHFKDWLWSFNLHALLRIQAAFTRLNSYLKQKSWETETVLESCAYKWFGFNCSFACCTLRYNMQCKSIFFFNPWFFLEKFKCQLRGCRSLVVCDIFL